MRTPQHSSLYHDHWQLVSAYPALPALLTQCTMITSKPIYTLVLLSLSISTTVATPPIVDVDLPFKTVRCGSRVYSVDQVHDVAELLVHMLTRK